MFQILCGLLILLAVAFIVHLIFLYHQSSRFMVYSNGEYVCSKWGLKSCHEASLLLKDIKNRLYYPLKERLMHAYPNVDGLEIIESDYSNPSESSYSLSKNLIVLCLRDPSNPERLYSFDTISMVFCHELAHCVNVNDSGHSTKFKGIFLMIKNIVYNELRLAKHPQIGSAYCGTHL